MIRHEMRVKVQRVEALVRDEPRRQQQVEHVRRVSNPRTSDQGDNYAGVAQHAADVQQRAQPHRQRRAPCQRRHQQHKRREVQRSDVKEQVLQQAVAYVRKSRRQPYAVILRLRHRLKRAVEAIAARAHAQAEDHGQQHARQAVGGGIGQLCAERVPRPVPGFADKRAGAVIALAGHEPRQGSYQHECHAYVAHSVYLVLSYEPPGLHVGHRLGKEDEIHQRQRQSHPHLAKGQVFSRLANQQAVRVPGGLHLLSLLL